MAEVIISPAFTHNSSLPQLFQRLDYHILTVITGSSQHLKVECSANRSGYLRQLASRFVEVAPGAW